MCEHSKVHNIGIAVHLAAIIVPIFHIPLQALLELDSQLVEYNFLREREAVLFYM